MESPPQDQSLQESRDKYLPVAVISTPYALYLFWYLVPHCYLKTIFYLDNAWLPKNRIIKSSFNSLLSNE